jgi:hypothetical protein
MLSFFKNKKYGYLKNSKMEEICKSLKKRLYTLEEPKDIIIASFCWTTFKRSRMYEICTERKPKALYKEPNNLPNLIESTIVDMWTIYFSYENSFSPIRKDILYGWLATCNETAISLLARAGWKESDLVILFNKVKIRYNEYSDTYKLSTGNDSKDSLKFGTRVVKNVFGESEINNLGLTMASHIYLSSNIVSTINQFKDYDLGIKKGSVYIK